VKVAEDIKKLQGLEEEYRQQKAKEK